MKRYVWPSGCHSSFSFTIDVDAESPQIWRSRATGIKGLNQLEQRRYGLREGIFNLLDLLERYGVRATCFVPGFEAATRPWLLEALAARGHEVGLHCWYHEVVADLSAGRFREILEKCIELFESTLGSRPVGFRSPSWEMTPESLEVLADLGILYDSSLSGYDHPYELGGMTEIPIQWPMDDAIFFRFVGGGADHWQPASTAAQCESWIAHTMNICRFGGVAVSTMHPWLTGRPGRLPLAEALLEHVSSVKGIWIATLAEIAAYHNNSVNKGSFGESAEIPSLPDGYF